MSDNLFDRLNEAVNNTEGSLVNFLTAFSPWLAPLPPAAMTYSHMREFLDFSPWLALAVAALVEILGFGTVSTALDFWFYNRRDNAKTRRAPLAVVVLTFIFYLALVLGSNVVIDVAKNFGQVVHLQLAVIAVRALLTLQTIPGALIVAVRTGHRDLLREIKREKAEKAERKLTGNFGNLPEGESELSETFGNLPRDWRTLRVGLDLEGLQHYASLSPAAVRDEARRHGVSERTVTNWRAQAAVELKGLQWVS